jgi:hypothetical protein
MFRAHALGLKLLLDVMHHRHGNNEDDGCDYLVQVKACMEDAPGNANRSESLHHLEITRRRCARKTQALKINQERNSA